MSTKSNTKKASATVKPAAGGSTFSGRRDPYLSKMEGAGVIVRFNADWAHKCANDDVFAAFVSVFEENVMPSNRPVLLNADDMGGIPEELQAQLITHAAKKFVDQTATMMTLTEKLYQKYWMSLSVDWQQRLMACDGYAAIKANFNLLALKKLLEATFSNPSAGGAITRAAIDSAWAAYHSCSQFDRETLAMYYKRFVQVVGHLNSVVADEDRRPSVDMQVTRFLASLNHRDSVYDAILKERAALSGDEDNDYPVSLSDALVRGAAYLLQYYKKSTSSYPAPQQQSATVYTAEAQPKKTDKPKVDVSNITCYGCGQKGHYRSKCPAKQVNSLMISDGAVGEAPEPPTTTDDDDNTAHEVVCYAASTTIRVKCDSCAEVSVVGEGFPIENLQDCAPLIIKGVGGSLVVTMVGTFGPLSPVYYHPDMHAHILSFGDIERVADVRYVQNDGFYVRLAGIPGEFHFEKNADNTFSCCIMAHSVLSSTIAERERLYTKSEVQRARGVRELKRNLAGASDRDLIEFITNGAALNLPYTLEDVRRAATIYGPDISCLKGKMTSPGPERPLVVRVNHGEQRQQELQMDIFEVSGVMFLISVMLPMNYSFSTYLPSKTAEELVSAVSGLLRVIQSKQFVITKIVIDPEGGLAALQDMLPVPVNAVAPGTHVPHAERRGRVYKERMRTILSALPFQVPKRFIKFLVFFITSRLALIPRSVDGSRICPRERFTGQKAVYNRELELCFGDMVQAYSKPTVVNSMDERCLNAMALYPCNNDQGAWKFYRFKTGAVVTSNKWTKTPTQDIQIQVLNNMAAEDAFEIDRGRNARDSIARVRDIPGQVPLERMMVNAHRPTANTGFPDGMVVTPMEEPAVPAQVPVPVPVPQEAVAQEAVAQEEEEPDEDIDHGLVSDDEDSDDEDADVPDQDDALADVQGSVWNEEGIRTSTRKSNRTARYAEVYKLSVAQAVAKYGDKARHATLEEFIQMRDKTVLQLMQYEHLTDEQRRRIIHSSLFLKEKYDDEGELERIKARLVASGNEMDRAAYSPGSSPTVATESVFILLAQSAAYNEVRYFVDIGTAFLEAPMGDEEVYMWVGKSLVPYLLEAMPEAVAYMDHKGRVLVKLLKALYGCIQSSRLWFEHIRDILLRGGFRANDYDCCVFHKGEMGNRCTVALHVDDLFITATTDALAQDLLNLLRANLKEVKVKTGRVNTYLGMRIVETDTHLEADMDGYVRDCVEWSGVSGVAKTPATDGLFRIDESSVTLGPDEHDRFHTGTAKLLFASKRCRPAIQTAVNFLCSRVVCATLDDENKLDRVMKYLNGTPIQPVKFVKNVHKMDLFAYVDAGYGVHDTGESRSGLAITLNGTPVLCKTMRQRIVTKSSTEAELVALSDGLTDVIWCREFIQAAGFVLPATGVGEDNMSVMALLESRKFGTARTKHISVRYFFICDRIAKGELVMVYVPTKEQLADILSKALVGEQFHVLQPRLHGDIKV